MQVPSVGIDSCSFKCTASSPDIGKAKYVSKHHDDHSLMTVIMFCESMIKHITLGCMVTSQHMCVKRSQAVPWAWTALASRCQRPIWPMSVPEIYTPSAGVVNTPDSHTTCTVSSCNVSSNHAHCVSSRQWRVHTIQTVLPSNYEAKHLQTCQTNPVIYSTYNVMLKVI